MKINKLPGILTSATLVFIFPSVVYSQSQTSSHRVLGSQGCVNLRAEPSINAAVLTCLPVGTNVQIVRIPPTGRFAWVEDDLGNLWYYTADNAWISPDCLDLFENSTEEKCIDYGPDTSSIVPTPDLGQNL